MKRNCSHSTVHSIHIWIYYMNSILSLWHLSFQKPSMILEYFKNMPCSTWVMGCLITQHCVNLGKFLRIRTFWKQAAGAPDLLNLLVVWTKVTQGSLCRVSELRWLSVQINCGLKFIESIPKEHPEKWSVGRVWNS